MKRNILLTIFLAICLFALILVAIPRFAGVVRTEADPANIVEFVSDSNNQGKACVASPVYYAKTNPYADLGEGIVDKNCFDLHQRLNHASSIGDLQGIRLTIARGANVNASNNDYDGVRPLRVAVLNKHLDAARLLIDNGAEVNDEYVCCMGSDTALTLAIRKKDIEMVRFLLSRGADASCTARFEPYPSVLHEAIESRDRNIILAVLAALIIF